MDSSENAKMSTRGSLARLRVRPSASPTERMAESIPAATKSRTAGAAVVQVAAPPEYTRLSIAHRTKANRTQSIRELNALTTTPNHRC